MTTKEEYFNNEAKRLSTLNYNLYTEEKMALSEEEYAEYVKAFKEARNKFRNDYYIYAQSLAKKMAQEEFDGETGKNYIAKFDKADFNKLLFYQNNVNHNLELYEDWAKKYTLGGCSSCFNRSNIDERISINDLKDLWFISLLKTEIERRIFLVNSQKTEDKNRFPQLIIEDESSDIKGDENA